MIYKNIYICLIFLASCMSKNNGSGNNIVNAKAFKNDSIAEQQSDKQHPCFLKLKKNTITIQDSAFAQCYANVLIEYAIENSQIGDSVKIYKIFILDKKSNNTRFSSDSGFKLNPRLAENICVEALQNLKESSLTCNSSNVLSWGRIAMRITFSKL